MSLVRVTVYRVCMKWVTEMCSFHISISYNPIFGPAYLKLFEEGPQITSRTIERRMLLSADIFACLF